METVKCEIMTQQQKVRMLGFGKSASSIMRNLDVNVDKFSICNNPEESVDSIVKELEDNFQEVFTPLFQDAEKIVLFSCLGGRGGQVLSKMLDKIMEECKHRNIELSSCVVFPFSHEGKRKKDLAQECVDLLSSKIPDTCVLKNNIMIEAEPRTMASAFKYIDDKIKAFVETKL